MEIQNGMINIEKNNDQLIFIYEPYGPVEWIEKKFSAGESITLKKTFTFDKNDLIQIGDQVEFYFGVLENDFYKIKKEILSIDYDLFIHKDIKLLSKYFVAVKNISIFKRISSLINESIYLDVDEESDLPFSKFLQILSQFPNSYELDKYAQARVGSIISDFIDSGNDAERSYRQYMNKKLALKEENLPMEIKNNEIVKYKVVLQKIERMLSVETNYPEKKWQKEIIQIILLLYPKYISVFSEAPIYDSYSRKERSIDYLLVDYNGNVDIIEIKQPFDKCIVTKNQYRDNYIPLRELSGTVMQVEKYIYYLNKWGRQGENKLRTKYKHQLPEEFEIKITNPSGIIIMGRDNNLSIDQKNDFEIIKRKYKNLIDVITYDDLMRRLEIIIKQLEK